MENEAIQTNYEIGQDNVQLFGLDIHNPVFAISSLTVIAFVLITLMFQDAAAEFFGALRPWLTSTFDWFLMGAANIFVLFALFVMLSPLGKVRLGGKDAKPEWGYFGWFAMLFSAGMGIGLMFFGVLEPVNHFLTPPLGVNPDNLEAARSMALAGTIFHWGLHPWAIYAVVALSLAFFSFNHGLPLTMRSVFFPLLGDRVWGWPGHIIDVLAVFATLFGLATSLGFGAQQAAGGLHYLFNIPATILTQVVLIALITGAALVSVLRGLDGGVKKVSELNMCLAGLLLLFVIVFGSTGAILTGFFTSTGAYLMDVLPLSNPFGREDTAFMHDWTTFYWAWWISWSPFVGMFIARVSYGRSVREFILCVLIVPTIACVLWMNAFGGSAISQYVDTGYTGVTDMVTNWTPELSLYAMLEPLPLTSIASFIGIVLVIVFFVTSSDSGSLVIDSITAGGKLEAPVAQRAFWAIFEGLVAIALLLGGGLASLQAAAVSTGLPFALVLLVMCYSTYIGLKNEPR
ncbi:BCCT family transporter [Salinisphaera aquimarina]|uniref:BCCT family transporter n=1 Tax=Salinisphaera aquimarina TaxID=2094031 RepID=A0ABV7ET63_9GAMM